MTKWPDNKRIAVMIAFDLDAETMWTTRGDGNAAVSYTHLFHAL